jgi:hypothetical protein
LEGRWKGDGRLTARHLDQWLPVLMKCRIAKAIQPSLPAIPIAHDHPWGGTGRTASKEACPVPFRYTPDQMFRVSRHVPLGRRGVIDKRRRWASRRHDLQGNKPHACVCEPGMFGMGAVDQRVATAAASPGQSPRLAIQTLLFADRTPALRLQRGPLHPGRPRPWAPRFAHAARAPIVRLCRCR